MEVPQSKSIVRMTFSKACCISLLLLNGCTAWHADHLVKALPVESSSDFEIVNEPSEERQQTCEQTGRSNSHGMLESTQLDSQKFPEAMAEFQLPEIEAQELDNIYRLINDADKRRVDPQGRMVHEVSPLIPLPAQSTAPNGNDATRIESEEIPGIRTVESHSDAESLSSKPRSQAIHDPNVSPAVFQTQEKTKDNRAEADLMGCRLPPVSILSLQVLGMLNETQGRPAKSETGADGFGSLHRLNDKRSSPSNLVNVSLKASSTKGANEIRDLIFAMESLVSRTGSLDPIMLEYLQIQLELLRQVESRSINVTSKESQLVDNEVLEKARMAYETLRAAANLTLKNVEFCTEINGFGQIKSCPSREFSNGQTVLLYGELENHVARIESTDGKELSVVRIRTAVVIRDNQNNVAMRIDFPVIEDRSLRKRRDFYLYVPLTFENLTPGTYRLFLTTTDVTGNLTTTMDPPLSFSIR